MCIYRENPYCISPSRRGKSLFLTNVTRINVNSQVVTSSMTLFNDMKMRVTHAVETSYGFNTSQASQSISSNVRYAQALLARNTFIYRVCPIIFLFVIR